MKDYSNYFKGPSLNEAKEEVVTKLVAMMMPIMFQEIWSKLD